MMERIGMVSILAAPFILFTVTKSAADGIYEICRVGENLKVLNDSDDANSCRRIAVSSQAQEYQIGCRDLKTPERSSSPRPSI
jgi:hypothetical protein